MQAGRGTKRASASTELDWRTAVPESVAAAWIGYGVEDLVDIAGLYVSDGQLLQESFAVGLDEAQQRAMVSVWKHARARAGCADAMVAAAVEAGRSDTRPSCPQRTIADVSRGTKKRAGVLQVDTPSHPDQWRDGTQRTADRRAKASPEALDELFAVWEEMGPDGDQWQPCQAGEESARRRLMLRPFVEMEQKRVAALLAALRRWRKWNQSRNLELGTQDHNDLWPSAIRFGEFLESVSGGGSTAAPGLMASLKWWHDHVGVPFPINERIITDFKKAGQSHEISPALPVALILWFRMIAVARASKGAISVFVRLLLLITMACARYKHVQDSTLLETTDRWFRFKRAKGKRRVQGVCPPFDYLVPRIAAPDLDIGPPLVRLWESLASQIDGKLTFYHPRYEGAVVGGHYGAHSVDAAGYEPAEV